jgi:RND superfamily putative drug exporter
LVSCVCFSFLLAENPVIKMLAPGLGLSVLIDATVIRPALVPATMSLLEACLLVAPRPLGAVVPQMRRSRPRSTDRCR